MPTHQRQYNGCRRGRKKLEPMMDNPDTFEQSQLDAVNGAVSLAEELVSNHYKMSTVQWRRRRYDIKTLAELTPEEMVHGPFAQIVRYQGNYGDPTLSSRSYDFYKICLQDHAILAALREKPELELFPFILYIVTHELIHIVRFSNFLQFFDAPAEERTAEEKRVHLKTHEILESLQIKGLATVLEFYNEWRIPYDKMTDT
jgi:hypothetical protein